MIGDPNLFISFNKCTKGGAVTFGDNKKGRILGQGSVGNVDSFNINNVCLVDGLSFSLLSISQLTGKGFAVNFDKMKCEIKDDKDVCLLVGNRVGGVYILDLNCMHN